MTYRSDLLTLPLITITPASHPGGRSLPRRRRRCPVPLIHAMIRTRAQCLSPCTSGGAHPISARTRPSTSAALLHEYVIEEDEMGDSTAQSTLLDYLVGVLRWMYRAEGWFVARNLTLYHPAILNSQQMISPDIAVFTGIPLTPEQQVELTSWDMRPPRGAGPLAAVRPCPPVLFEVSSGSTWRTDIIPRLTGVICQGRALAREAPCQRTPAEGVS